VGHEHVVGFLAGGIAAWDAAGQKLSSLPQMPVDELRARLDEPGADLHVLDVRRASEYAAGHVPGARLAPLHDLQHMVAELDRRQPTAVICAGGYRSSAAVSLLARAGFERLYNVVGGTAAWQAAGHAVESA
jgi:rhodanese-related sulfurtransferase